MGCFWALTPIELNLPKRRRHHATSLLRPYLRARLVLHSPADQRVMGRDLTALLDRFSADDCDRGLRGH